MAPCVSGSPDSFPSQVNDAEGVAERRSRSDQASRIPNLLVICVMCTIIKQVGQFGGGSKDERPAGPRRTWCNARYIYHHTSLHS